MNRTLEHILPRVQKPARYTGGEYNAVVKDRRDCLLYTSDAADEL